MPQPITTNTSNETQRPGTPREKHQDSLKEKKAPKREQYSSKLESIKEPESPPTSPYKP